MRPDVAAWLARARADAEARGLQALVPLLETLARSSAALRDAAWTAAAPEDPSGDTSEPDSTTDGTDAPE